MLSKNINDIPDRPYLNLLQNVDFNPIFIMGEHRSGTTLLYQILVATECFNFFSVYHLIKYDEILYNYANKKQINAYQALEKLFTSLGISDRVVDRISVNPNLPEEYGFVLKKAGYEYYLNPENLPLFTELCRKIQLVSHPEKPLLLKSPWCFPHFMYVKSTFPKAKFIFIHRNPIHSINSKFKLLRSILSTWNPYIGLISQEYKKIFNNSVKHSILKLLYSEYFALGLRRILKGTARSTSYFLENINSLSRADYISITYEDLCKDPETTMLKILQFLGLQENVTLEYDRLIQPRPLQLLPDVQKKQNYISQKLEPYFAYHGYDA